VVLSRADAAPGAPSAEEAPPFPLDGAAWGGPISGVTGEGTAELIERLWKTLAEADVLPNEGTTSFSAGTEE
jgi:hypothetical protein